MKPQNTSNLIDLAEMHILNFMVIDQDANIWLMSRKFDNLVAYEERIFDPDWPRKFVSEDIGKELGLPQAIVQVMSIDAAEQPVSLRDRDGNPFDLQEQPEDRNRDGS